MIIAEQAVILMLICEQAASIYKDLYQPNRTADGMLSPLGPTNNLQRPTQMLLHLLKLPIPTPASETASNPTYQVYLVPNILPSIMPA